MCLCIWVGSSMEVLEVPGVVFASVCLSAHSVPIARHGLCAVRASSVLSGFLLVSKGQLVHVL